MIAVTSVNAIETVSPQVWFVNVAIDYNGTIYLQDKEICVQSTVEAPYLYLLASSGGFVKDQIMYVKTRLEDLEQLREEISVGGKEYRDRRYFPGDSPAGAIKSGQRLVNSKAFSWNIVVVSMSFKVRLTKVTKSIIYVY